MVVWNKRHTDTYIRENLCLGNWNLFAGDNFNFGVRYYFGLSSVCKRFIIS